MRRRHRNSNLPFMFGAFAGLLCVMTVGYAVFSTNLNINVKGNIKEMNAAKYLQTKVVTSGDGLYKDTYEENRYVYKGANPNNYITFNGETAGWRIISVEKDGTLKMMKKDSIGNRAWDATGGTYGSNNWARPADLYTYLNGEYYNDLSSDAKNLIEEHTWGIGTVVNQNTDLAGQIALENSATYTGNIGLISASDAVQINTNTIQCGNLKLHFDNDTICKSTNYITSSFEILWTITSYSTNSNVVFAVTSDGYIDGTVASTLREVAPALYLKSEIRLSGEGTESNPYTII